MQQQIRRIQQQNFRLTVNFVTTPRTGPLQHLITIQPPCSRSQGLTPQLPVQVVTQQGIRVEHQLIVPVAI